MLVVKEKKYIFFLRRELPNSLFCNSFAERWKEIEEIDEDILKMQKIKEILIEIPSEHCQNIKFLFKILNKVKEEEFYNKMGIDNLLIVPGPAAVLWDSSGAQVPINSVYTLMIERYDWIFNEDTTDPGNPLYSKFNASLTSLASLDSPFNSMMSQHETMEGKDQLREFLKEDENVVKRRKSVRDKLKTNSRNRVIQGSGSFDIDFDLDKETGSLNDLSDRRMRFGSQRRIQKLKMVSHSLSFDSEMDVDTKTSNTPTNSPVMSSLAVQSENGLSVSVDGIFEMTGSHYSDDDDDVHVKRNDV